MGTDIHAIMQVKDRYSNIYRTVEVLHIARNYRLFGALSDVRNGYGCAGCDTGDAVIPIDDPRGLPDEMEEEFYHPHLITDEYLGRMIEETVWLGGHSHSWLMLDELLTYNWDQTIVIRGYIHKDIEIDDNQPPEEWCGWTNKEDYVQREWNAKLKDYINKDFFLY